MLDAHIQVVGTQEKMPEATSQARTRIIPSRRPLLPTKGMHKLNPSAIPAEVLMKTSHEEAKTNRRKGPKGSSDRSSSPVEEDDLSAQPQRVEISFATSPQPFLDPPSWEAMLKHSQQRLAAQAAQAAPGDSSEASALPSHGIESAERLRQRVDRETEYGSMAIRGRSSVRGRGKRARGNGGVYWGGKY